MVTAMTGMDALTHAIEAIHALQAEPISDTMAVGAIRLIMEYLPSAWRTATTWWRGVSSRSPHHGRHSLLQRPGGDGARHGPLCRRPLQGAPRHGQLHPPAHVMMYNMDEAADRYALVAEAMGVKEKGMSDEEAGGAAVDAVFELTRKLASPRRCVKWGRGGRPARGLGKGTL